MTLMPWNLIFLILIVRPRFSGRKVLPWVWLLFEMHYQTHYLYKTREVRGSTIFYQLGWHYVWTELYLGPSQLAIMELFVNIVNVWKPLIIFAKGSIIDV